MTRRLVARLPLVILGVMLLCFFPRATAQTVSGAICVSTFADANGSGARDAGEAALAGVNVNLSTAGVIIATHITAADEAQYCFEDLIPGVYTVTFTDSPTYHITTSNEGTFALAGGQRLTINSFGAVPIPPENLRAQVAAKVAASKLKDKPLETPIRLLLATVASMVVMIFMIGVGAVIFGIISGGRKRRSSRTITRTMEVVQDSGRGRR